MPLKTVKRPVSKRKQNGKKVIKGQLSKSKQKLEMETTPKEQISELEKEIFTIKINESESKLKRKKHLCSYMEEEISIYKTLYNEKQLLKSESMKLLNKAYEDFSTEIFLLDQELGAMQHKFNKILERRNFCAAYKERVEKLSILEAKLGENLFESEKCFEELPELSKTFAELQEKAASEFEKFNSRKQQILREFETCLLRIQTELNLSIERATEDKNLKLDLLPVPYKDLFLSGWMSSSWLDCAKKFYKSLQQQNSEIERKYNDLLLSSIQDKVYVKKFFSDEEILLLFQLNREEDICHDREVKPSLKREELEPPDSVEFENLNKMVLHQKNKVKSMKLEAEKLEKTLQSLEISGDTYLEKSYLVQIVFKAGNILKQEL